MHDQHHPVTQHDIASYEDKFKSKSFRLTNCSSFGAAFEGKTDMPSKRAAGTVSSQRLRQG